MRVLVTGGAGFLGRQIVAALRARGAAVAAPARSSADLLRPEGRQAAVAGARAPTLVHAAWVTRPGVYRDSPENLDWVAATLDLAGRFAAAGGRRFVLVGSCAEYDWSLPPGTKWTEERPCRPATVYGAAKLLAWTMLAGMPLAVANARVFWPIGPHEHAARLLPSMLRAVRSACPLDIGPAALTRDLLDVRDAGGAIAGLALSDAEGVVNIGSGIALRLDRLAAAVGDPQARLLRLGARPLPAGEPLHMVADAARLGAITGIAPRYSLARTIADSRAVSAAAA